MGLLFMRRKAVCVKMTSFIDFKVMRISLLWFFSVKYLFPAKNRYFWHVYSSDYCMIDKNKWEK